MIFRSALTSERQRAEEGFSLMEILIAILIIGVIGLGINMNAISSLQLVKYTELNYIASNLALSKIEELAAQDPVNLDSSDNSVESSVSSSATEITFQRTTTIVVNGDDSRTITVQVQSNSSAVPTQAQFSTTMAVWE